MNDEREAVDERITEIKAMIARAQFVKTTYIKPHEYIVRRNYPELFDKMTALINEQGYEDEFLGKKYRYYDLGDYKYWSLDIILNRTKIDTGGAKSEK